MRFLAVCVLLLGCKDKPKNQPVTPQAPPAAVTVDAAAAPAPQQGTEVILPKRTDTPPVKTTTPLTRQRADALANLEYPGWKKDVRNKNDRGLDIRYKTDTRPKLAVTLTVTPCFKCEPMELDRWRKHKDALRDLLSSELRDLPDTVFELGKTALAGAPLIYQYQLAYTKGNDPNGYALTAYSHAYVIYYNDATNMIRVVAEYKDDPPGSRQDLVGLAPREDLEKIALAFFDAYVHAW